MVALFIMASAAALFALYARKYVVVVGANKFALTRTFGRKDRVLRTGLHLLKPFETLVTVSWQAPEEQPDGSTRVASNGMWEFPLAPVKMDPPTIDARTHDGNDVEVNAVMWWNVSRSDDMFAIVDSTESPVGQLCDLFDSATRNAVGKHGNMDLLTPFDGVLAGEIAGELRRKLSAGIPIDVVRVEVQDIDFDEAIDKQLVAAVTQKQEHATNLAAIEGKRIETEARQKNELTAAAAEALRLNLEAENAARRATMKGDAETRYIAMLGNALASAGTSRAALPRVLESFAARAFYESRAANSATVVFSGIDGRNPVVLPPLPLPASENAST